MSSFDRVVLDARLTFKEGHMVFIAGLELHPRDSRRQARRALEALIAAVEAEGWQAVDQEAVGTVAEVKFHRAR